MNINRVVISGNLTQDPDLRAVGQTSVCRLRVAVNTRRKNAETGMWEDKPNYFDVKVWGAQGENCKNYLKRGRGVAVDGRLEWSEWEREGVKRQAVEIIADNVQFLGGRDDAAPAQPSNGYGAQQQQQQPSNGYSSPHTDVPMDRSDFAPAPASTSAGTGDDDIPF